MSTPRERLLLAQNPLFRRILPVRNFLSEPASGTISGADAPYARGQNRTGLPESEPACAKVA
jgi:hypothetical protein